MKALILAGGRGKRLGAISRYRAKPMLLIKGRPFLEHILAWLKRYGFRDVVICTGYLSKQIEEYFGSGKDFGLKINYSIEKKFLGTAGGLRNAKDYIKGDFIFLNADTFIDLDLKDMVDYHYQKKNKLTMAIARVSNLRRYGRVEVDNEGRIISFSEKSGQGNYKYKKLSKVEGLINAGVYVSGIDLLKKIPSKSPASLERDVFPNLGRNWIGAYRTDSFFIDIGTVSDYHRLKSGRCPWQ